MLDTSIKVHACCRFSGPVADCALDLYKQGVRSKDVKSIVIELSELGYRTVGQPVEIKLHPKNEVDAQFSAPYSVAIACIEGKALLEEYSESSVRRPDVRDLMNKIAVIHSAHLDEFGTDVLPAKVTVRMKDGAEFAEEVRYAKGDKRNPLSWEEIVRKFNMLVSPCTLGQDQARKIVNGAQYLEDLADIRVFSKLLAGRYP